MEALLNNPKALTLRQRRLVSREIARQYRKWRKALRREPTEAERRQIIAIGFSIARKKMPSIPEYAANPSAPLCVGSLGELQRIAHLAFDPSEIYWVITGPNETGKYVLRVRASDYWLAKQAIRSSVIRGCHDTHQPAHTIREGPMAASSDVNHDGVCPYCRGLVHCDDVDCLLAPGHELVCDDCLAQLRRKPNPSGGAAAKGNPTLPAAAVGGAVGAVVANALSNPRGDDLKEDAKGLRDTMASHLRRTFRWIGDLDDFDIEAAIYWYAHDHHEGQFSPLYVVLSTSPYKPGPLHRSVEDDGEVATMMYDELVRRFRPRWSRRNPTGFPFSDPSKKRPVYRPVRWVKGKIRRIRVPLTADMKEAAQAHFRRRREALGAANNPEKISNPLFRAFASFVDRVKAIPRELTGAELDREITEAAKGLNLTQEEEDRLFEMAWEYYDYAQPWRTNPTLMTVMGANPANNSPRRVLSQEARVRRALANPKGRRRKVTMSLEKFWKLLQRKGDPRLMQEFKKKIEGYRKWTHGSMPKRVTLERIDVPGVSGVWLTYGMGRQPESMYVMPPGSKRKGAWRHPWTKMPHLKGDPQSGMILTKLVSGNRITDFLHG